MKKAIFIFVFTGIFTTLYGIIYTMSHGAKFGISLLFIAFLSGLVGYLIYRLTK